MIDCPEPSAHASAAASRRVPRLGWTLALVLCGAVAQAAPVTVGYSGAVESYLYLDLSAGLPLGTPVSFTLSFNETFSDGSYDFSDPLGPVSGTLHAGAMNYSLDGGSGWTYTTDGAGTLLSVGLHFTGTGPAIGAAEFYGLFLPFAPDLTLARAPSVGYGITTIYSDGISSTSYGYALSTLGPVTVTRPGEVPVPATLALAATGLLALRWRRRDYPRLATSVRMS